MGKVKTNEVKVSEGINMMAKALTAYAFRNGPVEDYHSNGQLSDEEMMTINKFAVNRIGLFLKLFMESKDKDLSTLLSANAHFVSDWDDVNLKEPTEELEMFDRLFNSLRG